MAGLMALSERLKLSAESRFFIQALMCQRGELLTRPFRVKPVAKLLCLTERLVREAACELAKAGLLVAQKRGGGVGRPSHEYDASKDLHDLLKGIDESTGFHQDLVQRLFSEPDIYAVGSTAKNPEREDRKLTRKDGRPAAPGAYRRLGASTRMLLAALLASADRFGVVAGVGEAKLRAMTGLSPTGLKQQVKRLISLGFVHSHVPGVSHGVFVGAKVASTYYLRLRHLQLQGQWNWHTALVELPYELGPEQVTKGLSPKEAEALISLGPMVLEVLYHKLIGYVSYLLSVDRTQLDAHVHLAEVIAQDLGRVRVSNPEQGEVNDSWIEMSAHFRDLAFELPQSWKTLLEDGPWQSVRLIPLYQGAKKHFLMFLVPG